MPYNLKIKSDYWNILSIIVFLFLIVILYGKTIFFDFNIDDELVTSTTNGKINNWTDFFELLDNRYNNSDFRPVTMASFGLENMIFGSINPSISHGINLFLFMLFCIISYQLLLLIIGYEYRFEIFITLILFISHPLNTEVICSIKSRDVLLSGIFSLLALISFIKGIKRNTLIYYFASFFLFLMGLLAKLDAAGVIIFIPLYLFYTSEKETSSKLKFYALQSIVFVVLFFIVLSTIETLFIEPIDKAILTGTENITENNLVESNTLLNRFASIFQTNLLYFQKILFPIDLRYYYGYKYYKLYGFYSFVFVISFLLHLLFGYLIYYFRKERAIILGLIGYVSFVLYALNFVALVAGIIADRYVFQSEIWFLVGFVFLIKYILKNKNLFFYYSILSLLVIYFLAFTTKRIPVWKNDLTLIKNDAPYLQNSFNGMRIASGVYKRNSDLAVNQNTKNEYLQKSLYYANLGNKVYMDNAYLTIKEASLNFELGNLDNSLIILKKQYEKDSLNEICNKFLGDVYAAKQDYTNSITHYLKAFNKLPSDYTLINNLATVYYANNQKEACLNFSKQIIAKDSNNIAAWENIGYFYLAEKDTTNSKKHFKKAIELGLNVTTIPTGLFEF